VSAEITADLSISFQSEAAYEDDREATLTLGTLSNSAAGLVWSGGLTSRLEYWQQGTVELRVDYEGTERPFFSFYGGGNPEPTVADLGRRQETLEQVIQFRGEQEIPFSMIGVEAPPTILFSTDFIDKNGSAVTTPRFLEQGGKTVFFTTAPAWGSVLIRYTKKYRVYRLTYNVNDRIINGDIVNWEEIPDMRVFVQAGFAIANINISRSVQWPQSRYIQEQPTQTYTKQETSRSGKIYRVFPPTEPDPVSGDTNYLDVEVVTQITYGFFEVDEYGNPVIQRNPYGRIINSKKWMHERFTGLQPLGSREIASFIHSTDVDLV